jgi:multimeric flavodoxin WrbA
MKVFVISTGHRNIFPTDVLKENILKCKTLDEYMEFLEDIASRNELSNSEVSSAIASFALSKEQVDFNLVRLNQLIDIRGKSTKQLDFVLDDILQNADGLIFCSPLHFGNPSSYLLRFLEIISLEKRFPFENKVIGQSVVGARRNGGQEAANIFGLLEYAQMGACVVGDGPPFSQSGGILESRIPKNGLLDSEGIKSGLNIGSRLVRAVDILREENTVEPGKISVIVENEWVLESAKSSLSPVLDTNSMISYKFINLQDFIIERCIGCSECPIETENPYKCIIEDEMEVLEDLLADSDGFIVCLEAKDITWSSYKWQTFIERTRYLRRGDYRFANIPLMSVQYLLSKNAFPFHIRILPPSFKHDMIFVGPSLTLHPNNFSDNDVIKYSLEKFCRIVRNAHRGRAENPYFSGYKEEARRFV